MTAADVHYTAQGDVVCADCESLALADRREFEAEQNKGVRGGLLDKAFLSRIAPEKRRFYWIGQIFLIGGWVAYVMNDWNSFYGSWIRGVLSGWSNGTALDLFGVMIAGCLAILLVWGTICTFVWPRRSGF